MDVGIAQIRFIHVLFDLYFQKHFKTNDGRRLIYFCESDEQVDKIYWKNAVIPYCAIFAVSILP